MFAVGRVAAVACHPCGPGAAHRQAVDHPLHSGSPYRTCHRRHRHLKDPDGHTLWEGEACDLATLIESHGGTQLDFRFDVLGGDDHGSTRPIAAHRAIRFAIDGD